MRGPLLSGPLGSAAALDAVARRLGEADTVALIGPLWLGQVLSTRRSVLVLVEREEKQRARRSVKRATGNPTPQRLGVVIAGVDLPLAVGAVDALVVEGASALEAEAVERWLATLVPALRPGGRLVALDATDEPAAEARLAGAFLAAALTEIVQDRPRDGVVLTMGIAPAAAVIAQRFAGSVGRAEDDATEPRTTAVRKERTLATDPA